MKERRIMMVAAALIIVAGMGVSRADAAMGGHRDAMARAHRYFVRHSLGFSRIFYQYHPGPHWDLMHARALHLTAYQIREERRLAMGMMRHTRRGIMVLRRAYRRYRADARRSNPSVVMLIRDVRAVGRAQTYLGYVMIPFHMKGYRLLDRAQRATYHRLARENWMHVMRTIRG